MAEILKNYSIFRSALEARGIRLNPPASEEKIRKLERIIEGDISPSIREVMSLFDGFNNDFDQLSFVSVWNIDDIMANIDKSRIPYVPFADRGLHAETFEVCATNDEMPVLIDGIESFQSYLDFWDAIISNRVPF
jgi:hypothetical protein